MVWVSSWRRPRGETTSARLTTLGQAETMTAAKVKRGETKGKGSDVEAVDLSPFSLNFLLLFILFFMEGTLLVITDQEIVMKNDIPQKNY